MGGHWRDGRLRAHIDEHMVGHLTYLFTSISVQPVQLYPHMLQFLGDFLGKAAQREEHRLVGARA
eukprot:5497123-Pyramimonas_sp.AAC.1